MTFNQLDAAQSSEIDFLFAAIEAFDLYDDATMREAIDAADADYCGGWLQFQVDCWLHRDDA